MIRFLPVAAAAALSVATPIAAHAFPPVPKVPSPGNLVGKKSEEVKNNDRKQMSEINRLAQQGIARVPGNFFGKFEARSADMAKARVAYDDCAARIETVVDPDINEGALRRWNEFKLAFEQGELQLPAAQALDPIEKLHGQNIPVQDADLDALDAAIAGFEKGVHPDNARVLAKWKETASAARKRNAALLESATARAAKDAADLDLKKRNAVLDQAEAALKAMEAALKADAGPIDAAVWASFEDALTKADAFSEKIRTSFTDAAWIFRVYDAWYANEVPKAVATAYSGGTLHASGAIAKKEARVSFDATPGNCYILAGRFKNRTGNERVAAVKRVWGKDFADVVPFVGGRGLARYYGACPTKAMRLDFDITLESAGSKVAYDWVAVSWPRTGFPVDMAARSEAEGPVGCSAPMMENVFRNAVPGLLLWTDKGEPVLNWGVNQGNFMVRSPKRHETQVSARSASIAWPTRKELESTTFHESCSGYEHSIDPLVQKMIQCHQSVDKQYAPQYASARKRREDARTIGAVKAANDALARIEEAEKKTRASKCGPHDGKVEAAMSAAIERLNDWFLSGTAPEGVPDVPAYVRDVYVGRDRFTE